MDDPHLNSTNLPCPWYLIRLFRRLANGPHQQKRSLSRCAIALPLSQRRLFRSMRLLAGSSWIVYLLVETEMNAPNRNSQQMPRKTGAWWPLKDVSAFSIENGLKLSMRHWVSRSLKDPGRKGKGTTEAWLRGLESLKLGFPLDSSAHHSSNSRRSCSCS